MRRKNQKNHRNNTRTNAERAHVRPLQGSELDTARGGGINDGTLPLQLMR